MTATDLSALTNRMATSSTGYGAVIGGVLNIRTVTETAQMAACNALCLCNIRVIFCEDPDCDCLVKALAHLRPDIKIIPVKVEAA